MCGFNTAVFIIKVQTKDSPPLPHAALDLTHLCPPLRSTFAVREMASLGQQMLNATVGKNGLMLKEFPISVTHKGTHNTFNSQTFVFSIISQNYAFSIIFQNYVFLNSSHNHA